MDFKDIKQIIGITSDLMNVNKDYLVDLDSKFGDGDLGISMQEGYRAIYEFLETYSEDDWGRYFLEISKVLNENAPSSLGTIISFMYMGMAKYLKDKKTITDLEFAFALEAGVNNIMLKAKSELGQKTILDSLYPAIMAFKENLESGSEIFIASKSAYDESVKGAENTKNMLAVHGRAAYHNEKTLGMIDAGAEVGRILFEAIFKYYEMS